MEWICCFYFGKFIFLISLSFLLSDSWKLDVTFDPNIFFVISTNSFIILLFSLQISYAKHIARHIVALFIFFFSDNFWGAWFIYWVYRFLKFLLKNSQNIQLYLSLGLLLAFFLLLKVDTFNFSLSHS